MAKNAPAFRTDIRHEIETTSNLLKRLVDEVTTLFQKEIALAKSEISDAASSAKRGAVAMASGGFVAHAGFLVLLSAAVFGLAEIMELWLAALIVGAVVTLVGMIMVQSGKKKLDPAAFKPERTQASLQKDKEMVQRRTS